MPLHPLEGHFEARRRLAKSVAGSRLPRVLLLTGPEGIGKQRLALWLAQLVFCERPTAEPCGSCRSCRLVLGLTHPDLHWFLPIPRPKSAEPDKQVEEASESLAELIGSRRERPFYGPSDGMSSHSVASARLFLRRAVLTPVEARRKFFILAEADRLVPQESSPEAANALLKMLEEPPADTCIVLTTTEPDRLLPTLRSRAVPLRLTRIPDAEMLTVARALHPELPAAQLDVLIRQADGAIGALIKGESEGLSAAQGAATLLEATAAGRAQRLERCLRQAPWSARGGFTELLDGLSAELAGQARNIKPLQNPSGLLRAMQRVQDARVDAQGNVNPQLLLAALTRDLAEVL